MFLKTYLIWLKIPLFPTGKNGSWKEEMFTPELIQRADNWISENMAKIPGFAFPK